MTTSLVELEVAVENVGEWALEREWERGLNANRNLLVDLSNICRDNSLVPSGQAANWTAYESLLEALRRSDIAFLRVHLIADASLIHMLDDRGRAEFRRLERQGGLEVSQLADERLLEYAFSRDSRFFGALIASMDRFSDHRRRFPQIQGNTDRFIGWKATSQGVLRAFYRDMGTAGHDTMSRKEEGGDLKARRIRREDVRRRAESSYFKCVNKSCLIGKLWPDHLRELPLYDDRQDTFLCPVCRATVKSLGRRPEAVQLIVFMDGDEQARILLQRGEDLAIGRTDVEGCIGLRRLVSKGDPGAVSRRHIEFALREGGVQVRDLGSKNGTRLRDKRSRGSVQLRKNEWTRFRRGDILALADSVSIELSGRRVAFEGERPLAEPPQDDTDSSTRLIR